MKQRPLVVESGPGVAQAFGKPSNCGRLSVISNHGAFEPTKMCIARRVVHECPHGDVDVLPLSYDRIEERSASTTVSIVTTVVAVS